MMIMNLPKPRVFVSSVIDGFEEYRDAARRGIVEAGAEPVLVEDLPAQDETPRNVCLDGVASCDVVVVIVGSRAGWRTPSGQFAMVEEAEFARRRGIPLMVFLEDTGRDEEAEQIVSELEDYVDGRFRKKFSGCDELSALVRDCVSPLCSSLKTRPRDPAQFEVLSSEEPEDTGETTLRVVVAPERDEEVIDPAQLQSKAFSRTVLEAGHRDDVDFFSYRNPHEVELENDWLVIRELASGDGAARGEVATIRIQGDGTLVLETRVTGRDWDDDSPSDADLDSFVISEESLETELLRCFAFLTAVIENIDPFGRQRGFHYQPVLLNAGNRTFEKEPQPRSSYEVNLRGPKGTLLPILDSPRLISRESFGHPGEEVSRLLAETTRKLR